MSIPGIDALGHPDPATAAAAGKRFICVYLKNVTRAYVDACHAHGLGVVLVSETTGRASLGGNVAGSAEARSDVAALRALGAPAGIAVYSAEDDLDVSSTQAPTVVAFMRAYRTVINAASYRAGFYGGLRAVQAVAGAGAADLLWQTYAWSGGTWDRRDALEQYLNGQSLAGTGVDLDRAVVADFGAWLPEGNPDMALTPGDAATVWSEPIHTSAGDVSALQALADIRTAVRGIAAAGPGGAVDVTELATALSPLLHAQVDPAALAAALAPLVGQNVLAVLAAHPLVPKP